MKIAYSVCAGEMSFLLEKNKNYVRPQKVYAAWGGGSKKSHKPVALIQVGK